MHEARIWGWEPVTDNQGGQITKLQQQLIIGMIGMFVSINSSAKNPWKEVKNSNIVLMHADFKSS
jgi:hypothetical protein